MQREFVTINVRRTITPNGFFNFMMCGKKCKGALLQSAMTKQQQNKNGRDLRDAVLFTQ